MIKLNIINYGIQNFIRIANYLIFEMKHKYKFLTAFLSFVFLSNVNAQSVSLQEDNRFYIGLGTSVTSYFGEDFGGRYFFRSFFNSSDRYNSGSSYYSDPSFGVFPLNLQLTSGYKLTEAISTEVEASFIWHARGYMNNPDFQSGQLSNNRTYVDRNDYASMVAVPVFLNLKFHPFGDFNNSLFLKTGFGAQFVSESIDRVRKVYEDGYFFNTYTSEYLLHRTSGTKWMSGTRLGAGYYIGFDNGIVSETDITYTLFFNHGKINGDPLAINTSGKISMISLSTRVYFRF